MIKLYKVCVKPEKHRYEKPTRQVLTTAKQTLLEQGTRVCPAASKKALGWRRLGTNSPSGFPCISSLLANGGWLGEF